MGFGFRFFYYVYLFGDFNEGGVGFYLYMRDGYNGIVGIKIEDYLYW